MQQIMDEELALKLVEDERRALMAQDEAAARELALCLGDSGDDDDTSDDSDDFVVYDDDAAEDEDAEDDDDDDYSFDLIDTYAPGDVSLQSSSKSLNSLRESLRRQDKSGSRRGPACSGLDSNKFASRDSAFDERTRMVLLKLMHRGKLDTIHERIHTGRDANMYRAVGTDTQTGLARHFAVKLFKTSRGDFTKANECDASGRVHNDSFVKKTLRRQLKEWTEREYRHLRRAASCGVQTPTPLLFKDHVLVMDLVGDKVTGTPAPKLKDAVLTMTQLHAAYVDVLRSVRTLYQNAQLVHARLSESNIMYHDGRCWLVDLGDATAQSHPHHIEHLEKDLNRMHAFFQRRGVRRAFKDALGVLPLTTAREFVTSDDPERVLQGFPRLKTALLAPAAAQ